MKKVALILGLVVMVVYSTSLFAQRKPKTTTTTTKPTTTPTNTGGGTDTTGKGGFKRGRGGNTTGTGSTSTGTNPAGARPKKIYDTIKDPAAGSKEYGADVKPSKRNPFGYQANSVNERKALPYDFVREDDATYSVFVWREIDAREKMNLPFIYGAKENDGDQRFFSILLDAIKNDSIVAFSADDDRFTTPLTFAEVMARSSNTTSELDTTYSPSLEDENILDTVISWKKGSKAPAPDSVYKFRIKEQWFFDREASRMMVRIIGIAPLAPDQRAIEMAKKLKGKANAPAVGDNYYQPVFWIYYPDIRTSLARHFAYNPKNAGARQTWEEIFEGRFFSSTIIKSSLDNPKDLTLARTIKDPLFRLLEAENIKEKIFNYEQDLWSY